jgi:CheY-like chemotaxis protein
MTASPTAGETGSSRPKTRVLVVDDDAELLDSYVFALEDSGYDVARAASGKQALALVGPVRPDVIVTDISMPEMDGLELLDRLRSEFGDAAPPTIVCSAFRITRERVLQHGARSFLTKPVDLATLKDCIEEALRGGTRNPSKEELAMVDASRQAAREIAARRLARVGLAFEGIGPWLDWLRTYFGCEWSGVYLQQKSTVELVADSSDTAGETHDQGALAESMTDVVATRASLVVADTHRHLLDLGAPAGAASARFLVGVPLLTSDDVAVGALCLADGQPRSLEAESLVVLEHFAARAAVFMGDEMVMRADLPNAAPLLRREIFETLLAMELQLAVRTGQAIDLALVEVPNDVVCQELADALWRLGMAEHLGIGRLGPARVAYFKPGAEPGNAEHVAAMLEAVRARGLVAAASTISVQRPGSVSEEALVRLAEQELAHGVRDGHGLGQLVIGPGR